MVSKTKKIVRGIGYVAAILAILAWLKIGFILAFGISTTLLIYIAIGAYAYQLYLK